MLNSLQSELCKFGAKTSVPGIQNAFKAVDRFLRTVWILALIVSLSMTVWQLNEVFVKYLDYRTTTTIREVSNVNVSSFPQVTVCNLQSPIGTMENENLTWKDYADMTKWRIDNLELLFGSGAEMSQKKIDKYRYEYLPRIASSPGYIANLPISSDTVAAIESFVANCTFFDWTWNLRADIICSVSVVWDSDYYRCITIRPPDELDNEMRGLVVYFYLNDFADSWSSYVNEHIMTSMTSGIKVAVHPPGVAADMSLANSISPGSATSIKVSTTQRIRLPAPYGKCVERKWIDVDERYTSDRCFGLCQQQRFVDECGCLSGYFPFNASQLEQTNRTMCVNQSLLEPGAAERRETFQDFTRRFICYVRHTYNSEDVLHCDCQEPCDETIYDTTTTGAAWPNRFYKLAVYKYLIAGRPHRYGDKFDVYGKIMDDIGNVSDAEIADRIDAARVIDENFVSVKVYYESYTGIVLEDQPAMTVEQLASNIGGTLSLWMGITTIWFVELFEILYNTVKDSLRSRVLLLSTPGIQKM